MELSASGAFAWTRDVFVERSTAGVLPQFATMRDEVKPTQTSVEHRNEAEALDDTVLRSKIAQQEVALLSLRKTKGDVQKMADKLAVFRDVLEAKEKRSDKFLEVRNAPGCMVWPHRRFAVL